MPFTTSHVVAVLPLAGRGLPVSALFIGAMIPDHPLFVRHGSYAFAHSPMGILTVNLALGLGLWLLWSRVLRRPTMAVIPGPLRRWWPYDPAEDAGLLRAAVAVAIGAATHVIWDGFTHGHGFAVKALPVLAETVATAPIYGWLQAVSSVFGLLATIVWLQHKRSSPGNRRWPVAALPDRTRWLAWAAVIAAAAAIGMLDAGRATSVAGYLFRLSTASIAAFVVGAPTMVLAVDAVTARRQVPAETR